MLFSDLARYFRDLFFERKSVFKDIQLYVRLKDGPTDPRNYPKNYYPMVEECTIDDDRITAIPPAIAFFNNVEALYISGRRITVAAHQEYANHHASCRNSLSFPPESITFGQ